MVDEAGASLRLKPAAERPVRFAVGPNYDLQNIGLAASLLGWSAAQIRAREAEVIEFADIGRHIDEPVKHYSSGMVVRLGKLSPAKQKAYLAELKEAGKRPRSLLSFRIDEGPRVTIRSVSVLGNLSFALEPHFGVFGTDSYLLRESHVQSDPARGLINGGAYSREILEEDLDRLRLFKELGVRVIQLAYNWKFLVGDGCTERTDRPDFGFPGAWLDAATRLAPAPEPRFSAPAMLARLLVGTRPRPQAGFRGSWSTASVDEAQLAVVDLGRGLH